MLQSDCCITLQQLQKRDMKHVCCTAKDDDEEPGGGREFKRKHRAARRGWQMPEGFPNSVIVEAYTEPRVDEAKASNASACRPQLNALYLPVMDEIV